MLIWVCIVGSIILYFMVGYRVFRNRDRLRSFPTTTKSREAVLADDDVRHSFSHLCVYALFN